MDRLKRHNRLGRAFAISAPRERETELVTSNDPRHAATKLKEQIAQKTVPESRL